MQTPQGQADASLGAGSLPLARPVLVVGIGNDLRGDDSVGLLAAQAVLEWNLPEVRVVTARQLTPELAVDMSTVSTVVFVDASTECPDGIQVRPVMPEEPRWQMHHLGPGQVLSLTALFHGRAPRGILLGIAAQYFELGSELSTGTCSALATALAWLQSALRSEASDRLSSQAVQSSAAASGVD